MYLQIIGMVFQLPHFGVLSYREHLILLNNDYLCTFGYENRRRFCQQLMFDLFSQQIMCDTFNENGTY